MDVLPKAEAIQQAVKDVADETTADDHNHEWATIVFEASPGCFMYYPPFPGEFDHVDQMDLWNRIRILNEAELDPRAIVHSHNNPGSYTPGLSQGDRGAADLYEVNIVAVEPGLATGDMSAVHTRSRATGKEKTSRKFGTVYDPEVFSDL